MNKEEYIKWTDTTAIYPDANTNNGSEAMYLLLGYKSEMFEFMKTEDGSVESMSELSDCCWYLARLEKIFGSEALPEPLGDIYGHIKKFYRDGTVKHNIKNWIYSQWEELQYILDMETFPTQVTIEDLFNYNVKKLEDRKGRNVLKGSGDNR